MHNLVDKYPTAEIRTQYLWLSSNNQAEWAIGAGR